MQDNELIARIAHCVDRGGLNLSDISRWVEAPLPTVREWAKGRKPHHYKRDEVFKRLDALEKLITEKPDGIIPHGIAQQHRSRLIVELRNATLQLPEEGAPA
jgi:hypothetical protein